MNKILTGILVMLSTGVFGQNWSGITPGNIFYNSGNVGVGTATPEAKVHVVGDESGVKSQYGFMVVESTDAQLDLISNADGTWGSAINFVQGNVGNNIDIWSIARQTTGGSGNSSLRFNYGTTNSHLNSNIATFNASGNIGFGTTTPEEKLHVIGTSSIEGNIGTPTINHWLPGSHTLELTNTDAGDVVLSFHRAGLSNAAIKHSSSMGLIFSGNGEYNSNHMHITRDGYVGIGTSTPGTYKLAVEGKIGAREIQVKTGTWADYVFEEDYKLADLSEVEKYIKENKHLPGIPTTAEVEKDGVNLGEMNVKLLEKVEELTLYVIELKKEIEELKELNKDE
ncbi:hypothetical protein JMN32_20510 [Fulvivirga sp. 29W222]|uniref:Peptidase S74 domain-containing protein n=1 Tax=Fulvivirga marina TaxID=2494733 RepID=A0A937G196_9BACT|nr:tail fiber protein [Fulvivirga marina]MBL6448707.1 hypothetical protein [Fulvivirga marina]